MLTLQPPKAQNLFFPTGTCQIFAILPKFLQNLCWIFAGWASIKPRTAPWSPKQQLIELVEIFSPFFSLTSYLFPFLCLGLGLESWNSRRIKPQGWECFPGAVGHQVQPPPPWALQLWPLPGSLRTPTTEKLGFVPGKTTRLLLQWHPAHLHKFIEGMKWVLLSALYSSNIRAVETSPSWIQDHLHAENPHFSCCSWVIEHLT